jgi:hypothetical protein
MLLLVGCSHPTTSHFSPLRFPLIEVPTDYAALAALQNAPVKSQPWMMGECKPPTTKADLGLHGKLHLAVFRRSQRDPAYPILIADSDGHLFAFCATSETDYSGYGDAFVLGALRPSSSLIRVHPGSDSYRFLFSLVWSFAKDERYQCSRETLEKARASLHLSEAEFRELMSEPR